MLKYFILVISFLFMACQAQQEPTSAAAPLPKNYYEGALFLKQQMNFKSCDLNTICAPGLSCAYFDLNTGPQSACVDVSTICQHLGCTQGRCLTLESYPAQIRCAP